ncbi:cytochrome P450 4F8 [Metarhizium album ARSEF 1941]|uniref:Cytochrome P450 4F8 n=1 Tax=Metarhizium album (strain ARSEF 1941) TaxID=1081103 RepID=A0A0B2WEP8_METAS|nr:cytochrome P450 4F8 [Metarhizium album ARSEF 1941]KHN94316.1 cytochrome P450 4F8 [Metarhizium album ARSEF 1941]
MALFVPAAIVLAAAAAVLALSGRNSTASLPRYKSQGCFAFLSDARDFATTPIRLLQKATRQCGDVFSIQVLSVYNVWLRGNSLNKVYLETREDVWSFVGGMGLFLNKIIDRGYWSHYRTLLSSLSRYVSGGPAQRHAAAVSVEETQRAAAAWSSRHGFELFDTVSYLVHKIIVRSFMGQDFYEHNVLELFDLLHSMEADIGSLLSFILPDWVPHPPARRLHRARDRFKEIFTQRLRERARDSSGTGRARPLRDYVAFTMEDDATVPLEPLMPSHHTMLMFAAHTSTAASISWTIIALLRHPDVMEQVTAELRSKPEGQESLLLQACIKETTRLYCGVKLLRLARENVYIPGPNVSIPKGAVVSISPYLTHLDPANFPEPQVWNPRRWIGNEGETLLADNKTDGVKFLPFGGGSHRCVGEKMAMIIVTKTVATLLREYDFCWETQHVPEKTDFSNLNFDKVGTPWLRGGVRVRMSRASSFPMI